MSPRFTTSAVFLQLLALLLLQWYPLAPHFLRRQAPAVCSGDHALCGCAPDSVAAGTCCCSRNKPRCHDGASRAEQAPGEGERAARHHLKAAPCGGSVKFVTASLDKLKFLQFRAPHPAAAAASSQGFPLPAAEKALARYSDPPDPPPKLHSA